MGKITFEMVENWLGSDRTLEEAIKTLVDLANDDYDPALFAEEVEEYQEDV